MPVKGTSIIGTALYIQQRARVVESGCVEWTSTLSADGYGRAVVGYRKQGRPVRDGAHRVSYVMWKGAIPTGMDIDHLCRNRKCINPAHLEAVSRAENVRRGLLPKLMKDRAWRPLPKPLLDVCKNGHKMAGDNVGTSEAQSRRWCRACKRECQSKIRKTK